MMRIPLSVCIITKNEKEKLRRCLNALQEYDFEMILVDTGSDDGTKDMARAYTDKIYDFAWCDDFARARNFAIEKASNSWILILDSDECMEPLSGQEQQKLYELLEQNTKNADKVGLVYLTNQYGKDSGIQENEEWIYRVFRKDYYHYEGRIHEQVVRISGEAGKETFQTPIRILHDGYGGTDIYRKKKAQRNIELLTREMQEKGEDPYLLYQIGKSCYMAGDYKKAAEYMDRALYYDLDPNLEYVIDLVESYGYALLNSNQKKQAMQLLSVYEEFGN